MACLSYYFGGKRGAYLAALQMVQSDLQMLTRPIRSDGDIAAQIRGMARRHFEYFRAHPQVLLGLLASAPSDPETRAIEEATQTQAAEALLDLLGLRKPATDVAYSIAWLHGFLAGGDNALAQS